MSVCPSGTARGHPGPSEAMWPCVRRRPCGRVSVGGRQGSSGAIRGRRRPCGRVSFGGRQGSSGAIGAVGARRGPLESIGVNRGS